jgi:hypothetical protein
VQLHDYDAFSRQTRKYLPFTNGTDGDFKENAVSLALAYYAVPTDATIAPDTRPFNETKFESSPLNRPDKDYGPGQEWGESGSNKYIDHQYLTNVHAELNVSSAVQEAVILWKVDGSDAVQDMGYYPSLRLSIKVTFDENGNAVREYVNNDGKTILKKVQALSGNAALNNLNGRDAWASTYYVYDDIGNLVLVIPPAGVKEYLDASLR